MIEIFVVMCTQQGSTLFAQYIISIRFYWFLRNPSPILMFLQISEAVKKLHITTDFNTIASRLEDQELHPQCQPINAHDGRNLNSHLTPHQHFYNLNQTVSRLVHITVGNLN